MIITIDLSWLSSVGPAVWHLFPYFLISFGFGIAFYYMFYFRNDSFTKLDQMKHDLEVKKEWIRMISEQNKENAKKAAWTAKYSKAR